MNISCSIHANNKRGICYKVSIFFLQKTSMIVIFKSRKRGSRNQMYLPKLIKPIKLVKELHECSLNLTIRTCSLTETTTTNGIDLIHKDDAGLNKVDIQNYFQFAHINLQENNLTQEPHLVITCIPKHLSY